MNSLNGYVYLLLSGALMLQACGPTAERLTQTGRQSATDEVIPLAPDCAVGHKVGRITVRDDANNVVCASENIPISVFRKFRCPSARPAFECDFGTGESRKTLLAYPGVVLGEDSTEFYAILGLAEMQGDYRMILTWGDEQNERSSDPASETVLEPALHWKSLASEINLRASIQFIK